MNEVPEFTQFLATLGVGGVLAGIMFFVNRKDNKEVYTRRISGGDFRSHAFRVRPLFHERCYAACAHREEVSA